MSTEEAWCEEGPRARTQCRADGVMPSASQHISASFRRKPRDVLTIETYRNHISNPSNLESSNSFSKLSPLPPRRRGMEREIFKLQQDSMDYMLTNYRRLWKTPSTYLVVGSCWGVLVMGCCGHQWRYSSAGIAFWGSQFPLYSEGSLWSLGQGNPVWSSRFAKLSLSFIES